MFAGKQKVHERFHFAGVQIDTCTGSGRKGGEASVGIENETLCSVMRAVDLHKDVYIPWICRPELLQRAAYEAEQIVVCGNEGLEHPFRHDSLLSVRIPASARAEGIA